MINRIFSRFRFGRKANQQRLGRFHTKHHFLFVPSYDFITQKIAGWARSWKLSNVTLYHGNDVRRENVIAMLDENEEFTPVIVFVGHGSPTEVLTGVGLGKGSTLNNHDCLLDADDLRNDLRGVQILAWSCSTGGVFGKKVGQLTNSSFFGFRRKVVMLVNPESDHLWNGLISETISRITKKHQIDESDREWLRSRIGILRKEIAEGKISTGSDRYDTLNRSYLNWLSANVTTYLGRGES